MSECKNCSKKLDVLTDGEETEAEYYYYSHCPSCRKLIRECDWDELEIRNQAGVQKK